MFQMHTYLYMQASFCWRNLIFHGLGNTAQKYFLRVRYAAVPSAPEARLSSFLMPACWVGHSIDRLSGRCALRGLGITGWGFGYGYAQLLPSWTPGLPETRRDTPYTWAVEYHTLILFFLKEPGTMMKYKFILFSPWLLKSPDTVAQAVSMRCTHPRLGPSPAMLEPRVKV